MQKTHREGGCGVLRIPWTLSVCCVWVWCGVGGRSVGGNREGGSKLNVLQRTWGHNSLFFFNHAHFSSLFSIYYPHPPKPIPTPDQISAHRHSLSRHQHPWRGVSCLEEEEELTPPGSLIRFALRVRYLQSHVLSSFFRSAGKAKTRKTCWFLCRSPKDLMLNLA